MAHGIERFITHHWTDFSTTTSSISSSARDILFYIFSMVRWLASVVTFAHNFEAIQTRDTTHKHTIVFLKKIHISGWCRNRLVNHTFIHTIKHWFTFTLPWHHSKVSFPPYSCNPSCETLGVIDAFLEGHGCQPMVANGTPKKTGCPDILKVHTRQSSSSKMIKLINSSRRLCSLLQNPWRKTMLEIMSFKQSLQVNPV